MAQNRTVDAEIESLAPNGDGLARVGRRAVAVPFTIPGERVRVALQPGDRPADLVEVLRASPHRVAPRCPHFGPSTDDARTPGGLEASGYRPPTTDYRLCGGCTWQHIAYPEQLRLKTELVDRLVRAAIPGAPASRPMLASTPLDHPWGYRHKIHFVFGRGSVRATAGKPLMGHYARASRRVIAVRECPVHDPRGNALAFRFRDAYSASPSRGGTSTLEGLAVRVSANTDEIFATVIVASDADAPLRSACRRAFQGADAPTGFQVNLHPRRDAMIFGRETRRIAGPERMREQVADTSFLISPTAFFQTNIHAAEILVRLVLAEAAAGVPAGADVLDLYAGAGLFALPLAKAGRRVVAVEENPTAVKDGEASRQLNRIPAERCRFIARRVEDALNALPAAARHPGLVILDPPREGSKPAVLSSVFGTLRPPRAVYISCNPEAMARDLAQIADNGYTIDSLQPVDMFPHTAHIETVVTLTR